jgi:hypothetical protein
VIGWDGGLWRCCRRLFDFLLLEISNFIFVEFNMRCGGVIVASCQ